jgi:hypothetical protein
MPLPLGIGWTAIGDGGEDGEALDGGVFAAHVELLEVESALDGLVGGRGAASAGVEIFGAVGAGIVESGVEAEPQLGVDAGVVDIADHAGVDIGAL